MAFSISIGMQAQSNVAKGRLFYLPGNFSLYSMGVGYERTISGNQSFQILYNMYGYDMTETDGSSVVIHSIVPEYRIYLKKRNQENLHKAFFLGMFNEFSIRKLSPSGFNFGEEPKSLINERQLSMSPGMLIGKNLPISTNWFFEIYAGAKYRFVEQQSKYLENQLEVVEKSSFSRFGFRIGVNLACRF